MAKSIFTEQYGALLAHIRSARNDAGLTQAEVARRLGQQQSFVSKSERGERRLDVIEAWAMCRAIGTSLTLIIAEIEEELRSSDSRTSSLGVAVEEEMEAR